MAGFFDGLKGLLGGGAPQAQMPGQRQGLGALFSPEIAFPMAQGLLGNQGNMQNVSNAFGALGPAVLGRQRQNQTKAFFEKNAPEFAQMIDAGMPVGAAWQLYTQQRYSKNPRNIVNAGDGQLYDADTGEWISAPGGGMGKPTDDIREYQYAKDNGMFDGSFTEWQTKGIREQDPTFTRERDLRKDYDLDPNTKNYKIVRDNYERIREGAQITTGAGDIAVIFGYMKMLDPTSVVRENEQATAANAGGIPAHIRNLYNRVQEGDILPPESRAQIVQAAEAIYKQTAANLEDTNTRYGEIAGRYELDPAGIVQQPEQYEPLQIGGPPKEVAPGVSIRKVR